MRKHLAFVATIAIAAVAPRTVLAQHPAGHHAAVPDSIKKKYVGTWEGTYYSDHAPENVMKISIAHDTAWKVTVEIVSAQNLPATQVVDFHADHAHANWTMPLMGMPCESNANLVAGSLKGEINCGHASIGFLLQKRK